MDERPLFGAGSAPARRPGVTRQPASSPNVGRQARGTLNPSGYEPQAAAPQAAAQQTQQPVPTVPQPITSPSGSVHAPTPLPAAEQQMAQQQPGFPSSAQTAAIPPAMPPQQAMPQQHGVPQAQAADNPQHMPSVMPGQAPVHDAAIPVPQDIQAPNSPGGAPTIQSTPTTQTQANAAQPPLTNGPAPGVAQGFAPNPVPHPAVPQPAAQRPIAHQPASAGLQNPLPDQPVHHPNASAQPMHAFPPQGQQPVQNGVVQPIAETAPPIPAPVAHVPTNIGAGVAPTQNLDTGTIFAPGQEATHPGIASQEQPKLKPDGSIDDRKSPRMRSFKGGMVVLQGQMMSSFKCKIRNESRGGVMITLSHAGDVPDEFYLVRDSDPGNRVPCRVAWRAHDRLGAMFVPVLTGK